MKLGTTAISTLKLGASQVAKAYLGAVEVWSSVPSQDNVVRSPTNMTGFTSGAITVSADGYYGASYEPWRAFDGVILDIPGSNQIWASAQTAMPHWGKIDFGSGQLIYSVNILGRVTVNNQAPKDFTIDYSSDNSTWATAYTKTGETPWTASTFKNYLLAAPVSARYWRIHVTANQALTITAITEVQFLS